MQTILLTWWTWYIWSHAAVTFLLAGYNIVIIDNLSNSSDDVVNKIFTISWKKVKFYNWDLRNKTDIEKVFAENKIDWVIHFAGAKAVWESCDKPSYYWENNVAATGNLVEIMDKYNCKNIIFSSSATVYDPAGTPPFSEDSKTGWDISNPYGTNKYVIEHMLRDMSNHRWFNSICLRYFNPVWAHESGLIWEDPNDIPNNLLPFIMKVATWELKEIQVFGNDYDTKDWTWERDYIHVLDLIEGHIKALEFIEKNKNVYEEINLWTGKATSVLEMIKITKKVANKDLKYKIVKRRIWDIATSYCSPEKAKKFLNWDAKYSIEEAIIDSYNFIKNK